MTLLPTGARAVSLLALATLLAWAPVCLAQQAHLVAFVPGGTISLAGDSTLHKYACVSRGWHINALATGGALASSKVASIEVVVPVTSLKSGDGALDANLVRALKGDKFPSIRFVSTHFDSQALGGGRFQVTAVGRLAVAGDEHPATVHATATQTGKSVHLVGGYGLVMSAFGVKPPVLLGGMIKVADRIAVAFDLTATLAE